LAGLAGILLLTGSTIGTVLIIDHGRLTSRLDDARGQLTSRDQNIRELKDQIASLEAQRSNLSAEVSNLRVSLARCQDVADAMTHLQNLAVDGDDQFNRAVNAFFAGDFVGSSYWTNRSEDTFDQMNKLVKQTNRSLRSCRNS
jgi:multidrug resistance efflux pump